MSEPLANINLAELNLESAVRDLLQRLLNHIEVLTKENQQLKEEIQQLRDENARLKGEKGKPEIKANKKAEVKTEADKKKIRVHPPHPFHQRFYPPHNHNNHTNPH